MTLYPLRAAVAVTEAGHLLEVADLSVSLSGNQILHDVSLTVDRGEIVTIVGPNGSGKSTLLRSVVGAVRPCRGQVLHRPGLKIGYVPQRLHLEATMPMTVGRFLRLPARHRSDQIKQSLEEAGLPDLHDRQMTALSGGQFQRVLLARALLAEPDLLLLDEATQGLDQPATAAFYDLITDLRDRLNCAVLMVSHDLHVVMSASDRVVCLNGHICCQGTPKTVAVAQEYRAFFGEGTKGTLALYRHRHDHAHDDIAASASTDA